MRQKSIFLITAVGIIAFLALSVFYITPDKMKNQTPTELEIGNLSVQKIKDEIKTNPRGGLIEYQENSYYSQEDFFQILELKGEFKNQLIQEFKEEIIGVTAENCRVSFDESKKSATLKCDIRGASYGTNKYSMHFLLGNWPFDLYQFSRDEKKLVYEGKINGIPTKVIFEFPYSFSHCHEHVWPG